MKATLTDCILINNMSDGGYAPGGGAIRGTLTRCLIAGNSGTFGGGGVIYSTLDDCVVSNNVVAGSLGGGGCIWASLNRCLVIGNSGDYGGGCIYSTANDSVFVGNSAVAGGGARESTLNNCTVVGNSAEYGGGVSECAVNNSIVYYNTGQYPDQGGSFQFSCVPTNVPGTGNTTNPPQFVNLAARNFRLLASSPCINTGSNALAVTASDFDSRPRIYNVTVDMGAYEFQSMNQNGFIGWLRQSGLPTDGSADFTDTDADGANNWQEWRADTVPTNAASALLMGTATNGVTGLVVSWVSVATRSYWLERGEDLTAAAPFQTVATNIPGVVGTKTFNDTSATNGGPYFYRVGVQ